MGIRRPSAAASASVVLAAGAAAALLHAALLRRRLRALSRYAEQLEVELVFARQAANSASAEAASRVSSPPPPQDRTTPTINNSRPAEIKSRSAEVASSVPSPPPPQDRTTPTIKNNRPAEINSRSTSLNDSPFGGLQQSGLSAKHIEVGKFLGEGSFGAVHSGRWRGVPVALKFVKEHSFGGRRELVDTLSREVKVLHAIDHPNVMRLYGVCCTDDGGDGGEESSLPPSWSERLVSPPVLVCELLPGGNFAEFLHATADQRDEKARHWRRVASMLEGAASGLEYIHGLGVVHRDIKALNLFLDGRGRLKLGDFGLAKMDNFSVAPIRNGGSGSSKEGLRRPSSLIRVQSVGSLGTWTHVAPELMREERNGAPVTYTPAVDIFAFAIVIVEALGADVAEELIDDTREVIPGGSRGDPPIFGISMDGVRSLLREGWHCPETNALLHIVEECGSIEPRRRPRAAHLRADLVRVQLAPVHLELQLKTRGVRTSLNSPSSSVTSTGGSVKGSAKRLAPSFLDEIRRCDLRSSVLESESDDDDS